MLRKCYMSSTIHCTCFKCYTCYKFQMGSQFTLTTRERSPLLHVWCIMYTLQCGTIATQIHSSFSSFKCCTCRYRLTLNWSPPLLPFTQIHSSFSSFKYCTCYKFQVDSHSIAREQSTVTYVPRSLLLAIDVVNSARRGFGRERETYFDRNNWLPSTILRFCKLSIFIMFLIWKETKMSVNSANSAQHSCCQSHPAIFPRFLVESQKCLKWNTSCNHLAKITVSKETKSTGNFQSLPRMFFQHVPVYSDNMCPPLTVRFSNQWMWNSNGNIVSHETNLKLHW